MSPPTSSFWRTGGDVHVFKRPRSRFWQCGTYLLGRKHRESTKQESLEHAKAFAETWYLDLRGKGRSGELKAGKTAQRHGWLQAVPDLSPPYKTSGKIGHRAWFSLDEYRQLYTATRLRATQPLKERWRWEGEQLHDYVLFMANTGLRPDEAARLEYRDVAVVRDVATLETILHIEVRGKRGVGYCKSTAGAVRPFKRLRKRNQPQPSDRLFPKSHRELFNTILDELNLKFDRDGNRRTAYSLRHTYICLRLLEGADVYQIAKNCRNSVEMIEKYYAVHLKNTLDAAAINVRRSRIHPPRGASSRRGTAGPKPNSPRGRSRHPRKPVG